VTSIDPSKKQHVSFDELINGLRSMGFNLSYGEAFCILKRFDTRGDLHLDIRA
jgi:hypothetical protein